MATAIIIAVVEPMNIGVLSGANFAGAVVGVAVAVSFMDKAVSSHEPKYDPLPSNVAVILYMPAFCGVHSIAYLPLESLVAVPISVTELSELMANSLTGTPLGDGGLFIRVAFCPYR